MTFLAVPDARETSCMYGLRLEPENSLDVILIGPSGFNRSFYSPLAYEQQGFTSFTIGVAQLTGKLYETALNEALASQDPDLLVIDIRGFGYAKQLADTVLHRFLDVLPYFSAARINAIRTVVPDDQKISFINLFLMYHGEGINYKTNYYILKDKLTMRKTGFSITKNFSSRTNCVELTDDTNFNVTDETLEVADYFLALCREKGFDQVLFVRNPIPVDYINNDNYYTLLEKIEAAGYDFIDLQDYKDVIGIDYSHDWDSTGHLNIFGCEKYTTFFAEYLMDHYTINTEHSEKVKNEWDYCMSFNDQMFSYLKEKCEANESIMHFTQQSLIFTD